MVLIVAALLGIGMFGLYLVAANIFIQTRMLRELINQDADSTWIDYESAVTWWPGRVRVRGLRVRDRDSVSEWMIALDEGRASISLIDLLRRKFHPKWIRGRGFSFRVRSRLRPDEATSSRTKFIPPILGFSDPPLRGKAEAPKAPTGREWAVWLEDVAVGAGEIWVDDWKYEGEADLKGSMILFPRLRLEAFPSSLEVRTGLLQFRGKPVLASTTGRLEALIHSSDLRVIHGNAIFLFLTGHGRARGDIQSVAFLEDLIETLPRIRVQRGVGTASGELTLDRGSGHGLLDYQAKEVEIRTPDQTMHLEATGQMRLSRLDLQHGWADFSGSHLDVQNARFRRGVEEPLPWSGQLALSSAIVTRPERLRLTTHVEAQALDARPLYPLLGIEMPRWVERSLAMEGFTAAADVTLGSSLMDVSSLHAKGKGADIRGRYHKDGKSVTALGLVEAGPFAVGVSVDEGKTNLKWIRARTWYGKDQAGGPTP